MRPAPVISHYIKNKIQAKLFRCFFGVGPDCILIGIPDGLTLYTEGVILLNGFQAGNPGDQGFGPPGIGSHPVGFDISGGHFKIAFRNLAKYLNGCSP
jgi:hypothetical protein